MNADIREMLRNLRIFHYEIAAQLGINEFTFSRWLRTQLSDERRQQILSAIDCVLSERR